MGGTIGPLSGWCGYCFFVTGITGTGVIDGRSDGRGDGRGDSDGGVGGWDIDGAVEVE